MAAVRLVAITLLLSLAGCQAIPDIVHQPQLHNPFPQLAEVAVVPFFNQSEDPTINGAKLAEIYAGQLQEIPGFEVVPVGVTAQKMLQLQTNPGQVEQLRELATALGVDAVVMGSVTEYDPYYPPRLGLVVNWYAANPGFHPIPVGYGLPWGTADEEYIPQSLVHAAEFELAKEQLKTQTPHVPEPVLMHPGSIASLSHQEELPAPPVPAEGGKAGNTPGQMMPNGQPVPEVIAGPMQGAMGEGIDGMYSPAGLPPNWPDPTGFLPPPPQFPRPVATAHNGPIITQQKTYDGADSDFTTALANYYYFRNDARFGGWQGYLQRTNDFLRFCCHMHISEMLSARGGAGKTRVVWRWPIGRYDR